MTLGLSIAKNFLPKFLTGFALDLLEPILKYMGDKNQIKHKEKIESIRADMAEQAEITKRLKIEHGWWVTALQRPFVFYPFAIHLVLIVTDTILASDFLFGKPMLGIPKLPEPYDYIQMTVVTSYFIGRSFEKVGRLKTYANQLTKKD